MLAEEELGVVRCLRSKIPSARVLGQGNGGLWAETSFALDVLDRKSGTGQSTTGTAEGVGW